jgi:hypothetical protein
MAVSQKDETIEVIRTDTPASKAPHSNQFLDQLFVARVDQHLGTEIP